MDVISKTGRRCFQRKNASCRSYDVISGRKYAQELIVWEQAEEPDLSCVVVWCCEVRSRRGVCGHWAGGKGSVRLFCNPKTPLNGINNELWKWGRTGTVDLVPLEVKEASPAANPAHQPYRVEPLLFVPFLFGLLYPPTQLLQYGNTFPRTFHHGQSRVYRFAALLSLRYRPPSQSTTYQGTGWL